MNRMPDEERRTWWEWFDEAADVVVIAGGLCGIVSLVWLVAAWVFA